MCCGSRARFEVVPLCIQLQKELSFVYPVGFNKDQPLVPCCGLSRLSSDSPAAKKRPKLHPINIIGGKMGNCVKKIHMCI